MKKRIVSAIASISLAMLSITGCSQSASNGSGQKNNTAAPTEEKKQIVLKLGHGTATNSLYHAGSVKFKELVEAKTNGQIKVEVYSDGTIGHDKELIDFMKTGGAVQMGMLGVEPLTTIEPKLKVVNLPYLFTDRETAYKVLDGELGAEMVASLPKKQGLRVLAYFENGFRHLTNSKREILTPEDVKGLKIRTPQSPVSLSIFKALGANPTPMAFGEVFPALEQKVIDGQENPLSLIFSAKFYEVQKHVALTGHMYSPMVLAISEAVWSKLTPEQQKAVQEAANEARDYERKLSAEQEADLVKKIEAAGVKISRPDVSKFKEATKNVHLEFDNEYGADFYEKLMKATSK
ncbi:TRAP transporter substrate-binding protein [Effusibacillus lacus]|uniref:C4-dicarboxylate ABC transporter substrate-binding protein n=1 Tax=Effusibacillus lacus TaxID=1348429 RepID=A0A292YLN1_9BACL|nr:TRAP transporter substrate-binding protein [Effusibacillus lacus]TCS67845.1 tripartite ATP-independent transporter DctP family solute receptor [Effusibacillus lacus]GAX89821.1 C4-dicarboxylate ABC transporter substrate-binding protein [Effusibacillus lacus]